MDTIGGFSTKTVVAADFLNEAQLPTYKAKTSARISAPRHNIAIVNVAAPTDIASTMSIAPFIAAELTGAS